MYINGAKAEEPPITIIIAKTKRTIIIGASHHFLLIIMYLRISFIVSIYNTRESVTVDWFHL